MWFSGFCSSYFLFLKVWFSGLCRRDFLEFFYPDFLGLGEIFLVFKAVIFWCLSSDIYLFFFLENVHFYKWDIFRKFSLTMNVSFLYKRSKTLKCQAICIFLHDFFSKAFFYCWKMKKFFHAEFFFIHSWKSSFQEKGEKCVLAIDLLFWWLLHSRSWCASHCNIWGKTFWNMDRLG